MGDRLPRYCDVTEFRMFADDEDPPKELTVMCRWCTRPFTVGSGDGLYIRRCAHCHESTRVTVRRTLEMTITAEAAQPKRPEQEKKT